MEKLTNEERAKVFSLYWGQRIVAHTDTVKPLGAPVGNALSLLVMGMFDIEQHYLLLKPLSDISAEHSTELFKLQHNYLAKSFKNELLSTGECVGITAYNDTVIWCGITWDKLCYPAYQQLINWGYAVPIFFSPNHWSNGKTAIELGIAIKP